MPERCWREEDERDKAKVDWDLEFQRSERLIAEERSARDTVEGLELKAEPSLQAGTALPRDLERDLEEARRILERAQGAARRSWERMDEKYAALLDAIRALTACRNSEPLPGTPGTRPVITIPCAVSWTDTAKHWDPTTNSTRYTLRLKLEVGRTSEAGALPHPAEDLKENFGVEVVEFDKTIASKIKTYDWTASGRAAGSRSHYGCSGSAGFDLEILKLYGISEQALRSLAEQHVTYCDPFKIPFQL